MTSDECVIGATVICVTADGFCNGCVGTINRIQYEYGKVVAYIVVDKNGKPIGYSCWNFLNSWDIYTEAKTKTLSLECPCGIMRVDCDYHK